MEDINGNLTSLLVSSLTLINSYKGEANVSVTSSMVPRQLMNSSMEDTTSRMTSSAMPMPQLMNNSMEVTNISMASSLVPRVNMMNSYPAIHYTFNLGLCPVVMVIGIITNCVVVRVMQDPYFKKLPTSVFFVALAFSDMTMAIFASIKQILNQVGYNIFRNTKLCASAGFMINFASSTSSWLIVFMAIERLLVAKFPTKAKQISTKRKTITAVFTLFISLFILNLYNIFMVDYSSNTCEYLPKFKAFYRNGRRKLFFITSSILPLCITCICYILLVNLMRKQRLQIQTSSGGNTRKLNVVALWICLGFIILTSPFALFVILNTFYNWSLHPNKYALIFNSVASFLWLLNYTNNFLIYMVSIEKFRSITKKLFGINTTVNIQSSD